jgi:hypothetical protein
VAAARARTAAPETSYFEETEPRNVMTGGSAEGYVRHDTDMAPCMLLSVTAASAGAPNGPGAARAPGLDCAPLRMPWCTVQWGVALRAPIQG